MEKDKIINILKQPQNQHKEDIEILEKWVNLYPYFQPAHILIAKYANDYNSPNKEIKLNYAAIYSPNRGVLKRIILSDVSEIPQYDAEKLPSDADLKSADSIDSNQQSQEYPQFHEPISDDWQEKNEHYNQNLKDEYLIKRDASEIKQEEDNDDEISVPKVNQKLVDEVLANLEKARKTKNEYMNREEDEEPSQSTTTDHEANAKEQQAEATEKTDSFSVPHQREIIDIFIEKEKTMGKIQPRLNVEPQIDLSEKSTSLADDMVSENLASILRKQGKKEKAIDIYKKLIWKFPQKRAYFASLIEELKNN